MRTRNVTPLVALAFIALLAAPRSVAAQAGPPRNIYAGGGLGVTFGLDNDAGTDSALFALNEEVGYQMDPILLGQSADLALRFGLDLGQQFGDFFILTFGARVTGSFGVWRNESMAVRVAPSLMLGAAAFVFDEVCTAFGCFDPEDEVAFNVQFATQGELDLLDGLLTVWFRPLAIDGFIGDGSTARWNLMGGALVHF